MSRAAMRGGALGAALCAALGASCGVDAEAPTPPPRPADPDPLAVELTAAPGSLDHLYAKVIGPRCSGQPGLCHNGQFEPNLSTAGLTYTYLVNRPAIELPRRLRVRPGSAAESLLVDKLRNRNGVATQMPLGAEPLPEAEIAAIEAWIDGGARRAPGAGPAPVLNNPPRRPQIGVFSTSGTRLDGAGPIAVPAGSTVVLRHSVEDFETADADIPFAAVLLQAPDGRSVVLGGGADPHVGRTSYAAGGPPGQGDVLSFQRAVTIGSTIELYDPRTRQRQAVPAAGRTFSVVAVYLDAVTQGIAAFDVSESPIQVQ
jgi:hypothetical protein